LSFFMIHEYLDYEFSVVVFLATLASQKFVRPPHAAMKGVPALRLTRPAICAGYLLSGRNIE
jgi:hypothetical protein